MYGTFQVMTSWFLKYKAGTTVNKVVNNADTIMKVKNIGVLIKRAVI